MSQYKKILIALDLHDDNTQILETGREIREASGAETYLLHVNEPIALAYTPDGVSWSDQIFELERDIHRDAARRLKEIASDMDVDDEHCIIANGRPASEIHHLVESKKIDLIIMGTHGQSGLQLLLGSTANSVLHGVMCDVLAVRIKEKSA